ncbi:MAG: hypothetical protein AB8F95_06730 [Bacteroidia bacterium]
MRPPTRVPAPEGAAPTTRPPFADTADPAFFQPANAPAGTVQRTEQETPETDPDIIAGEVEQRDRTEVEHLNYAFFYTGGGYGNSAQEFFETHYPEHTRIRAHSFEQMFDQLYTDVQRIIRSGHRVHIDEIAIVTHANSAGGLQIPLARDDVRRHRNFTPWDLSALQGEFQTNTHQAYQRRQRFRRRRSAVVESAIDANTSVVVRGCEFGQSQDGMDALRSFFGGQAHVWAPRGFQGYEVAGIGTSHIQSAEEAFDMLVQQGLIPVDMGLNAEEKRQYLANELGITGRVASEFFIMGPQAREKMRGFVRSGQGLSENAEALKVRGEGDLPSSGEYWGDSMVNILGSDPDLDNLSMEEIERRARILNEHYRPEYAPMLQRLRAAWDRHPDALDRALSDDSGDPLAGLAPSDIFGSPNVVASDAAQFEEVQPYDTFETELLPFAPPSETQQGAASEFDEGLGEIDPNAPAPAPTPAPGPSGGGGAAPTVDDQGRQIATAEQLRAARDFRKSRELAEPEEPDCNMRTESPADYLGAGIHRSDLVQSILGTLPATGWQTSDYISLADITVSILTSPTAFTAPAGISVTSAGVGWGGAAAGIAALEVAGLFAPIVFTFVGFMASYSEAHESQSATAEVFGVERGLERILGDSGLPGESREDTIARWRQINWDTNAGNIQHRVAFGYPLSGPETEEHINNGMSAVLRSGQSTLSRTVRIIRREMANCGVSENDINIAVEAAMSVIRRTVNTAVARSVQAMLNTRQAQIEAQED